jgi:hypothetical protein
MEFPTTMHGVIKKASDGICNFHKNGAHDVEVSIKKEQWLMVKHFGDDVEE